MKIENFIVAKKGIESIYLDTNEISHVSTTCTDAKFTHIKDTCIVSMKNGKDLVVDQEVFVAELEKISRKPNRAENKDIVDPEPDRNGVIAKLDYMDCLNLVLSQRNIRRIIQDDFKQLGYQDYRQDGWMWDIDRLKKLSDQELFDIYTHIKKS